MERVVGVLIAVAVAAEVVVVADALGGGKLAAACARAARDARGRVEHERELRRQARWVIHEAIEATREGAV